MQTKILTQPVITNIMNYQIKLIFILSLFLSQSLCAQSLDQIKDYEVVFILYDGIKDSNKKKLVKENIETYEMSYFIYHYNFFMPNGNLDVGNSFQLIFLSHDDTNNKNKKPLSFKIHKSFIKKNKTIIFNYDELKKADKIKLFKFLKEASHILLIDNSVKLKNKQILIKEVKLETMSVE